MGIKDVKLYRSKRTDPYLPTKPGGTGVLPKGDIPRIDDPLLKLPGGGGGISKEILLNVEPPGTTASDDLAKFKKDVEATQVTAPEAAPATTKQSASELLRQYKQQIAEQQVAVPPIPEPGRELQYELRPVEKPMTDARPDPFSSKELEERREAQQSIQDLEKVLASLQKNRKGNYKPVTIYDYGPHEKEIIYRGFILEKAEKGDGSSAWTAYDPQSREQVESISTSPRKEDILEDVDALWDEKPVRARDEPRKVWDERMGIEVANPDYNRYQITPSDAVERGKLWRQAFYDWGLIDSVESPLPTIQEGADEFEKIREAPPVVEEVSAKLLPEETFDASYGRQSLFDPELKEDRRLLIMSCCITKTDDAGQIPALERYAGSLFQTLKTQGIPDDVDVAILSAKHGLIRINHPLSKYDTRMTKATQKKLLEDDKFTRLVQGTLEGYDDILVAGGKLYREPIRELSLRRDWFRGSTGTTEGTELPVPPGTITETVGSQGVQRQELKEWLRKSYGNDTLDEMIDDLRRPVKGSTKRETYGPSLHEFARLKGIKKFSVQALGLEGEIEHLDLESDRKPGQRLTVREDGMDLDDLVRAAQEAGYFGTTSDWEVGPDINQLLKLLDQSKRSPVYSEFEEDPDKVGWQEALDDLDRRMSELGIDLNQSNKAIRKELKLEELADAVLEKEAADRGETYQDIPFGTETTPQGEQTLMEGVDPVTTQDLLEVEAERPLRGGEAEAGPLFDVEGRAQMDLVDESRKTEPESPPTGRYRHPTRKTSFLGKDYTEGLTTEPFSRNAFDDKRQMNAIAKNPDFRTFLTNPYGSNIKVRRDKTFDGTYRVSDADENIVIEYAMSQRGKIYDYTVFKKTVDEEHPERLRYDIVKAELIDEPGSILRKGSKSEREYASGGFIDKPLYERTL